MSDFRYQSRLKLPAQLLFSLLGCTVSLVGLPTLAQITPDDSLGTERSNLSPTNVIDGGARRGANLFHSFSEFNIGSGQRVNFANPTGVDRILTRVTGSQRSEILGTLAVRGPADLFLINPNGIIFGPNAQLNVQGSFVASTANSLLFDNGFAFSTLNPQAPPLLTIRTPLGLQSGREPERIQLQGASLRVPNRETLALVGGTVEIDAAELLAFGGQIHLGGVNEAGTISIGEDLHLEFPENIARANVSVTRGSFMDVRAGGGGSITIQANTVNVLDGSILKAGIASRQGSPGSRAGDIEIHATGEMVVEGAGDITNDIAPRGTGIGGNLAITARSLSVMNGAQLSASTSGRGHAGNLTITTTDAVTFDGMAASDGFASSAFSVVDRGAIGNAGKLTITTQSLAVTNGAQLNTRTSGQGNAGGMKITAQDRVVIDGRNPLGSSSGLFSRVNAGAIGQGGDIEITTDSLSITNGAQLASSTNSQGDAGDVTINARSAVLVSGEDNLGFPSGIFSRVNAGGIGQGGDILITTGNFSALSGAELSASTRSKGHAGRITITASDQVLVNGTNRQGLPTGILSAVEPNAIGNASGIQIIANSLSVSDRARITAETRGQGQAGSISGMLNTLEISQGGELRTTTASTGSAGNMIFDVRDRAVLVGSSSGLFANTAVGSGGNGGSIFVNANRLEIRDRAQVAVGSQGSGQGGNIRVQAEQLSLENQAVLSAETASTQGGNITIQNSRWLLLRNNSLISASAGTALAGGNGGNITIDLPFIVSVLPEDNDIRANAFTGKGGNINIAAQGIFGIQFQPFNTLNSDITASSEFGLSGAVILNTPDLDPTQGIVELPTPFSTPLLAQGCAASSSQTSSFVNTGRGGVPVNPTAPLTTDTIWQDLNVPLEQDDDNLKEKGRGAAMENSTMPLQSHPLDIREAQTWKVLPNGAIALTVQASTVTPAAVSSKHLACP